MVPWLSLMEEQSRLTPGAPRRQVVGVEIEGARPRPVRSPAVVAPARLELLAKRGIGPDRQRGLRHRREILRDLRIDRLLDAVIVAIDLLAALRLELRAGAHLLEEGVTVALEADLVAHLVELGIDPG